MASEQQQRRVRDENVSEAREVRVEKDLVPNLASHFESLAEKVRDSEVVGAKEVPTGEDKSKVSITLAGKHGGREEGGHQTRSQFESRATEEVSGVSKNRASDQMGEESKGRASEMMKSGAGNVGKFEGKPTEAQSESKTPTLEEISKARQQAQQNSIDTIRRAEERKTETEQMKQGEEQRKTGAETEFSPAYGSSVMEKGRKGYEYAKEKLAGAGQTAAEYTKGTAGQAGEKLTQSTQAVPEYGRAAMEKSQQGLEYAKDKLAAVGQTATEYSKQTAEQARNVAARGAEGTVETAKNVKDYTAEKAVAAKDVTVESGKGAASMVGKVAGEVVDRAAMVGWGAAHLTAEAAVEGTKMAAKAVTGVAGYAKDTAVAVGSKATEIAAKQAENVKDVAASTGEKAKEYTARKQEEARRDLQCKQASKAETTTTQVGEGGGLGEKVEGAWESTKSTVSSGMGKANEAREGVRQQDTQQGPGLFGAIGETIMEIAQQTTELVAPGSEEDDSFLTEESGRDREQRVSK